MPEKITHSEWLSRVSKIHGNTYDYSKVEYSGWHGHVDIVCKTHGLFSQRACYHARGCECPKCALRKPGMTTSEWVSRAVKIHGKRYEYNNSMYLGAHQRIRVDCTIHGPFVLTAHNHLHRASGCPKCKAEAASKRGAEKRNFTIKNRQTLVYSDRSFVVDSSAEAYVIEWLLKVKKVKVSEIKDQTQTPLIQMKQSNRRRFHKPDFMVRDVLLEVKSPFTLGIGDVGFRSSRIKVLNAVRRKSLTAQSQGYAYRVIVAAPRQEKIFVLPKGWEQLSLKNLRLLWETNT